VVCSCAEPGAELEAAQELRDRLHLPGASVLGPVPLFRRQGRVRAQLVIRGPDREAGIAAVRRAVEGIAPLLSRRGVALAVDVDPQ